MKYFVNNYKERLLKYCFEDNWIEPPIYYNNKTKTLCFHLESKSEIYCATMISNVFDDVFYSDSKMFVAFYGDKSNDNKHNLNWKRGKKFFKKFSTKKILFKKYLSKADDSGEENPYVVICSSNRKNFKFKKFLTKYFADEQICQMAFISLKKGTTIQLYDSRGFDVLSADKEFLKMLFNKYKKDIVDFDDIEFNN